METRVFESAVAGTHIGETSFVLENNQESDFGDSCLFNQDLFLKIYVRS